MFVDKAGSKQYESRLSEYQRRVGLVAPGTEATILDFFFASLASLAENKFKRSDYSGRDGKVISINKATDPAIFSVFCVLSG